MPDNELKKEKIFEIACEIEDVSQRVKYLDEACKGNPRLRADIGELLNWDAGSDERFDFDLTIAASPVDPSAEEPGTPIGEYRIIYQIGEGGMGIVYLAEQTSPVRRQVALKVIKPGLDTRQIVARFETERQLLSMMDHPNIATAFDCGTTSAGRPFFVMEWVQGTAVTTYCDEHRLCLEDRLRLFIPICHAIQHAHQKGIIHRDIKPGNILVTQYDLTPVPKVIDFGIAKALNVEVGEYSAQTQFGQIVGSIDYMSPEQAHRDHSSIDTRSDIYSLGVVLYELLSGSLPFERERLRQASWKEILNIVSEELPPSPSKRLNTTDTLQTVAVKRQIEPGRLGSLLRGELDWMVMKAMAKDSDQRYSSPRELANDIQRFLNDEPVSARPDSATYRFTKFARRNRVLITSVSVIFVTLLASTVVSSWQALRANRATQDASLQLARAEAAEKDAVRKETLALESELDTRAFAAFLVEYVLMTPRPQAAPGGKGEEITVREALQAAEANIETVFRGRPRAEMIARHSIGATFRHLRDYSKAERHLRKAVELGTRSEGPHGDDTLKSRNSLGVLLNQMGRAEEAVVELEDVLRMRKEKYGIDDPLTINTLANLGLAYQGAGNWSKAIQTKEDVWERSQNTLGPNHAVTMRAAYSLSEAYQRFERHQEAIDIWVPLAEAWKENRSEENLKSVQQLAKLYRNAGRPQDTLPLMRQILEHRRETSLPSAPDTEAAINNLAATYWSLGRLDESIPLFEELLSLLKKTLDEDHPKVLAVTANLAVNYRDSGRLDEAMPLFAQVVTQMEKKFGKQNPRTLDTCHSQAFGWMLQQEWEKATPLLVTVLTGQRAILPPGNSNLAVILERLGECQLETGNLDEAEKSLREGLQNLQKSNPDSWILVSIRSLLGNCLRRQKRYADAEPLLLESFETFRFAADDLPEMWRRRFRQTGEQIIQLYLDWGKPDQVSQWQDKLRSAK